MARFSYFRHCFYLTSGAALNSSAADERPSGQTSFGTGMANRSTVLFLGAFAQLLSPVCGANDVKPG